MSLALVTAFKKLTEKYPWDVEMACAHLTAEDHGWISRELTFGLFNKEVYRLRIKPAPYCLLMIDDLKSGESTDIAVFLSRERKSLLTLIHATHSGLDTFLLNKGWHSHSLHQTLNSLKSLSPSERWSVYS